LVAHYYTDPEIQALAEETGGCVADSLEMVNNAGLNLFSNTHAATSPHAKKVCVVYCKIRLG